jgi:hypothetical protein
MIVQPKSKVLEADTAQIFYGRLNYNGSSQNRIGRYVVNCYNMLICECLLLDDDNNVIDGFSIWPRPELPWKGIPFIEYLRKINSLGHIENYDDVILPINISNRIEDLEREYWE